MDLSENSDKSAQFLVPEIVRRSKAAVSFKKHEKKYSPHVRKVYESKVRHVAALQDQNQRIIDHCDGLKQQGKSALFKHNDVMSDVVKSLQKSHKLQNQLKIIKQERVKMLEDFEKNMQEIDECIIESLKNYDENNLPIAEAILKNERDELKNLINGNNDDIYEEFPSGPLKEVTKELTKLEEHFIQKQEHLKKTLVGLQQEIEQLLECSEQMETSA